MQFTKRFTTFAHLFQKNFCPFSRFDCFELFVGATYYIVSHTCNHDLLIETVHFYLAYFCHVIICSSFLFFIFGDFIQVSFFLHCFSTEVTSINTTTFNQHCVKYASIRVFYDPHISVYEQNRRFCRWSGKCGSEKSRVVEYLTQCDTARVAALIILFVVLELCYDRNLLSMQTRSINILSIEVILKIIKVLFISAFQEKGLRLRRFRE